MKRALLALAVAIVALTGTGCLVTSVYPFYSDENLVFDPTLLGKWAENGGTTYTFVKDGEKAYRMTVTDGKPGSASAGTQDQTFIVRLFRLGTSQYLDAFPTDAPALSVGSHLLVKAELRQDTLTVHGLDVDAVGRAAGGGGPLLAHLRDDGTVAQAPGGQGFSGTLLFAPTAQLQAFVQKHEAEIFEKDGGTMKKVVGTDAVSR